MGETFAQSNRLPISPKHPIDHYIVDFVCIKKKLIIELDGTSHTTEAAMGYDKERTQALNQLGYRVLRFWNNDMMENIEGVYDVIITALSENAAH